MIGRHTSLKAKILVFSPMSFLFYFFALPLMFPAPSIAMKLAMIGAAIMLLEGVAASLSMDFSMMVRRYSRTVVSLFIRPGISSAPVKWQVKRFPQGVLIGIAILAANTDQAVADYTVTDSMRYDREWRAGTVGMGKENVVEVLCNQCDLTLALNNLLPDDFTIYIEPSIDRTSKISYTGGKPWGTILQKIAEDNDFVIEVMRYGRRVMIDPAPKNKGTVRVVSLLARENTFFDSKSFELIPGDTLEETLIRWADSEGWSVLYELENDLTIENYAKFDGNLVQVIEALFNAYKLSGRFARVQPKYSHSNTTIRISMDGDR